MKKFLITFTVAILLVCSVYFNGCSQAPNTSAEKEFEKNYTYASTYAQAQELGYAGTLEEFIEMLTGKDGTDGKDGKDGSDGKSAYQIWIDNGNSGTQSDFLNWLKGANGENGESGEDGKSAYEIWLTNGHTGSESEFLEWLKNDCAHDWEFLIELRRANGNEDGIDLYNCTKCHTTKAVANPIPSTDPNDPMSVFYYTSSTSGYVITGIVDKYIKEIDIPEDVVAIESNAFKDCKLLETVTMANSVEYIGNGAFWGCEKLQTVHLSQNLTSLGIRTFWQCYALQTITLPDSLTKIDEGLFQYCENLEYVFLPDNVTKIEQVAFYGCTNLQYIVMGNKINTIVYQAISDTNNLIALYYNGTQSEWNTISVGDNNATTTIYFYSPTTPTEEGNYWHYDENDNPVVW